MCASKGSGKRPSWKSFVQQKVFVVFCGFGDGSRLDEERIPLIVDRDGDFSTARIGAAATGPLRGALRIRRRRGASQVAVPHVAHRREYARTGLL
jgi:hypothetical protein